MTGRTFEYDGLNRITKITYSNPARVINFTWHDGYFTANTLANQPTTAKFMLDNKGRITKATNDSFAGRAVNFTYDNAGYLVKVALTGSPETNDSEYQLYWVDKNNHEVDGLYYNKEFTSNKNNTNLDLSVMYESYLTHFMT